MPEAQRSPLSPVREFVTSRYGLLLASLTAVAAFGPPLAETVRAELLIVAFFALLVFSAAVAVGHDRAARRRLLATAAVVLVADVVLGFVPSQPLIVSVGLLRAAFLSFVTLAILGHVVRTERVTQDTILGGMCVYVLIGLVFQSLFGIVEALHPGSFVRADVPVSQLPGADHAHGRYPALVYYSFVTLSTVGFGDITPTWSLPQSLSTTEAVIGQLYLAILVASLVGMRLAARESGGDTPGPDGPRSKPS